MPSLYSGQQAHYRWRQVKNQAARNQASTRGISAASVTRHAARVDRRGYYHSLNNIISAARYWRRRLRRVGQSIGSALNGGFITNHTRHCHHVQST